MSSRERWRPSQTRLRVRRSLVRRARRLLVRKVQRLRARRVQRSRARRVRRSPARKDLNWLAAVARVRSSKACACSRMSRAGGTFQASPGNLTKRMLKINLRAQTQRQVLKLHEHTISQSERSANKHRAENSYDAYALALSSFERWLVLRFYAHRETK